MNEKKAKICGGCRKYECDDYPFWDIKTGDVYIKSSCRICKYFKKFNLNRNRIKDKENYCKNERIKQRNNKNKKIK